MTEEWKPIENIPGYSVSSEGRVRNDTTGTIRKFKPSKGSRYAKLHIGRVHRKHYAVHKLVANAFLGKPPIDDAEINHLDGNRYNNSITNLEWCTHSENMKHANRTGICPPPPSPLTAVVKMNKDGEITGVYKSCVEAAKASNVPVGTIYQTLSQKNKKPVKGNIWLKVGRDISLTTSENKPESGSGVNE